jgi:membrane-bound lytic murein transglycosylase B
LKAPQKHGKLASMNRRLFITLTGLTMLAPSLPGCLSQTAPQAGRPGDLIGTSGDPVFDAWLNSFYARALAAGSPGDVLTREFTGLTPDPRVVAQDHRQPEISKPTGDYVKAAVSEDRVRAGARKRADTTALVDIEAKYGVASEVLTAIWGQESAFGAIQGDFDVIRSIASLAADGRRRELFEMNLTAALKIIAGNQATREQMKGSWAGAMGQTQFSCDDFLKLGVDWDGDGKKDLWASAPDALASAANLLGTRGWQAGQSWQREVTLPDGFDYGLVEGVKQVPPVWIGLGVVATDGGGWSPADGAAEAQLILPSGAAGPAFLIFPNHFVIRRYNNSTAYALGVGLLAERIAGRGGVIKPWPIEVGLSASDRVSAQDSLNKLGFKAGEADGVIGVNTRAAVRAWQKARGLVADAYLTPALIQRLEVEASAPV